jgi:hypothetical protein
MYGTTKSHPHPSLASKNLKEEIIHIDIIMGNVIEAPSK